MNLTIVKLVSVFSFFEMVFVMEKLIRTKKEDILSRKKRWKNGIRHRECGRHTAQASAFLLFQTCQADAARNIVPTFALLFPSFSSTFFC